MRRMYGKLKASFHTIEKTNSSAIFTWLAFLTTAYLLSGIATRSEGQSLGKKNPHQCPSVSQKGAVWATSVNEVAEYL